MYINRFFLSWLHVGCSGFWSRLDAKNKLSYVHIELDMVVMCHPTYCFRTMPPYIVSSNLMLELARNNNTTQTITPLKRTHTRWIISLTRFECVCVCVRACVRARVRVCVCGSIDVHLYQLLTHLWLSCLHTSAWHSCKQKTCAIVLETIILLSMSYEISLNTCHWPCIRLLTSVLLTAIYSLYIPCV